MDLSFSASSSPICNKRHQLGSPKDNDDNKKKTCNFQPEQEGTNTTNQQQWLFQRQDGNTMLLSENLGDTSAVVESLTHQIDNWSLTSIKSKERGRKQTERCKAAKRQVMRAMKKE
jgi:hypothetical protein